MAAKSVREKPNLLIVGTPCTGKSTLAKAVCDRNQLRHISVGDYAKEHNFIEGLPFS